MIHLGLDTSLGACSAALFDSASGQLLAADIKIIERGHAEVLGPMVEAIFASAGLRPIDLHRVIVTRGPGTFTGLRIGLAFAKGLALARGLPLLGIDSLWASAAPHFETATSIVVAHKAGATGMSDVLKAALARKSAHMPCFHAMHFSAASRELAGPWSSDRVLQKSQMNGQMPHGFCRSQCDSQTIQIPASRFISANPTQNPLPCKARQFHHSVWRGLPTLPF
jgi:tRNA threonylcarbamoyl adenosine modification protein YeaZ